MYCIHDLPAEERPRERLLQHGPEAMTTAELIAIILASGIKGTPILQLAQQILMQFGSLEALADATIAELCSIKGLGPAKALQLKAAISLGARIAKKAPSTKYRIEHPLHAYHLVKEQLEQENRELLITLLLDAKGGVISQHVVSTGSLSHAYVHPRDIFYPAIRHHATSLILAHNHPSGDPTPSSEDIAITKTLIEAGQLMNIPIQDHLIIGLNSYVSLRQKGVKF